MKSIKIFLVLSCFLQLFSLKSTAQEMPPAVVTTSEAVMVDMAPAMWISATVIGRYDSRLAVEVEGLIEEIPEVGETFNKGDVIARIKSRSYRLQRDEIASQIAPIEAELEFLVGEVKRLEMLADKNNAAKNRLDEVRADRDKSKAEIRMIRARLAMADDEINKTVIKAPFNGIVTERFKSPGEQVSEGEQLLRLVDTDQSEIQAWIPEQSLYFIQSGDQLEVRHNDVKMMGVVRSLIPVADTRSRMYELRLENPQDRWPIGHAIQVNIPNGDKKQVLAVPRDALVIRSQGVHIYRVSPENIAEMIRVKTGTSHQDYVEVIGQIEVGDRIVIRGNERLYPGARVLPDQTHSAS